MLNSNALNCIFGERFFDDFMDYPFKGYDTNSMLKTDVKDTSQGYEVTMDIPGIAKEDIKAELKDGYLTINAKTHHDNEEKDSDGRYIRRERYYGSCSRSFYVGDDVTQEDIKAKFEDGTLKMFIPKKEVIPAVEDKKYITIEG